VSSPRQNDQDGARAAILAQTPPSAEDAFAVLSENSTATDLIAFVGKWGQRNVAAGERTPITHFEYDRNVWGGTVPRIVQRRKRL
jgi:hypothetical protein